MTHSDDPNIVVVQNFPNIPAHKLAPERDVGLARCMMCNVVVRVWMRGWSITKQTKCNCPGGHSLSLSMRSTALKES